MIQVFLLAFDTLLKIRAAESRLIMMRLILLVCFILPAFAEAQFLSAELLLSRLKNGPIPEEMMSKRTVVLYTGSVSAKEIATIHEGMVRAGIDAVAYFPADQVLAGSDPEKAYNKYFNKREVSCIAFIQKKPAGFSVYMTLYNGKTDFVDAGQIAWSTSASALSQMMNEIYRSALSRYQKKNLLINESAEIDLPVKIIEGSRSETFAYDLKVDNLAVPNFSDTVATRKLSETFKSYPLRYQLTENTVPDKDLRNKGFLYVLCVVHARSGIAKELLGYSVTQSESAFVSVTYPGAEMQLKNIPADTEVYKFYVRHIDSGNVFLGTKWDADTTWQQALQNFIKGLRAEMKLN
jgi:hypothetical protein